MYVLSWQNNPKNINKFNTENKEQRIKTLNYFYYKKTSSK